MRCPCRKKSEVTKFSDCCKPLLDGERFPETAEALMRSRYSAFVIQDARYLAATWHASTRPAQIDFHLDQEWMQLRVVRVNEEGDAATVEFIACSRIGGASGTIHELSKFVREAGRWAYVDGKIG